MKNRLMTYLLLSIVLAMLVCTTGFAQDLPTPTSVIPESIFSEDICAPPCWFGMTPGESTIEDAKTVFTRFSKLFDNQCSFCEAFPTELIPGSSFDFAWKTYGRDDTPVFAPGMTSHTQNPSNLWFDDYGILDDIYIVADHEITLRQTIDTLGSPDLVYLTFTPTIKIRVFPLFKVY
jgi:hypothetical protein